MNTIIIIVLFTMLFSEDKYKEPSYTLINKIDDIEIRQYDEYIIARTSISLENNKSDNNMFRTLASYIFGGNDNNERIPMTAPVTSFIDKNEQNMIFYILGEKNIQDLPTPDNRNIKLEKFNLNKCAVINFSWLANKERINKYKKDLEDFIKKNNYEAVSPFMLNRYDPPWTLPFLRRNEIIVKIK
tara:strand:+ start:23291 stop:23848 length:558 start_codon:yes stop_codon:yes gene_type:complete